jgi:hypothetical protein
VVKELKNMTEPELRDLFTALARTIEARLPPGPSSKGKALFMLVVFDEPKLCQYVSNANRQDCIKAMRETAERFEHKEIIGS